MRKLLVQLLAALTFTAFAHRVSAQSSASASKRGASTQAEAPPGYEETVQLALHEFELENYAEARAGFLRAHKLYPNARTLRALGLVAYELKNYVTSVDYLAQALASHERALTGDQRDEVETLLDRARGYVGRYRVSLRPTEARLYLDGELLSPPVPQVLALSVGDHLIEAQADGYRPLRRSVEVAGGAEEPLNLVLVPLSVEQPAPVSSEDAPSRSETSWARKKWWLWTTLGLVVAGGVATGLVFGLREPDATQPSGGTTQQVLRIPTGN
jgi:tetratricopeptide (TPR) repeat protein